MKRLISIAIVLSVCLAVAQAQSVDDVEIIRKARIASNEAISRHDIPSMRSFLADDYVIAISTGSISRSRAEHMEEFAAHFTEYPDVVYVRTPTEIRISEAYPLAIERGTWTGSRTTSSGVIENGGEYTASWKRSEEGWKIYSEVYVALYCRGNAC